MVSQLDALQHGADYRAAKTDFRVPDGSGVVLYRLALPVGLYRRPAADDLALQLHLTTGALVEVDHGARFTCTTRAGSLLLTPQHVDVGYDMSAPASFIGAVLPAQVLCDALAGTGASLDFGRLHGETFEDEAVAALMRRMYEAPPRSRLLADSIWTTLALLLEERSRGERDPARQGRTGAVRDWRIRRTLEHIEERLAADVGLDELAREVGLSRRHYTTLFRAATGTSPHRWQSERRIERACHLLRTTDRSITEIAGECGFSSPQHLADAFRRVRQTSPSAYRRAAR